MYQTPDDLDEDSEDKDYDLGRYLQVMPVGFETSWHILYFHISSCFFLSQNSTPDALLPSHLTPGSLTVVFSVLPQQIILTSCITVQIERIIQRNIELIMILCWYDNWTSQNCDFDFHRWWNLIETPKRLKSVNVIKQLISLLNWFGDQWTWLSSCTSDHLRRDLEGLFEADQSKNKTLALI